MNHKVKLLLPVLAIALVLASCSKDTPTVSSFTIDSSAFSSASSSESFSSASSSESFSSASSSESFSSEPSSSTSLSSEDSVLPPPPDSVFEDADLAEAVKRQQNSKKRNLDEMDIQDIMVNSIYCSLKECGFEAFPALAVIDPDDQKLVAGIGYTAYEKTTVPMEGEAEPASVYASGFYQLVEDESEILINDDLVTNGLLLLPTTDSMKEGTYLVTLQAEIEPFSGIFLDKYFKYQTVSDYVVKAQTMDNQRYLWDEDIDLYDFDKDKYVFRQDLAFVPPSAVGYYQDEASIYYAARSAYEQIVEYQEKNGVSYEHCSLIIFSQSLLASLALSKQVESLNQLALKQLRNVELGENEYIMIDESGAHVQTNEEYDKQMAHARLWNGIIASIGAALTIVGSITVCVMTWGAGAPVAIPIILTVTAGLAGLYGTSNLVEGIQDIYYGANGDYLTPSINPFYQAFAAVFGDSEGTKIAYHAFGIACSLVSSLGAGLTKVVSTAVNVAKLAAKSVAVTVTRALVGFIAKAALTAGVSFAVNQGVTTLVNNLTGDPYVAKLCGMVSAIGVGFLCGAALHKLDQKLGLSFNRSDFAKYQKHLAYKRYLEKISKEDVKDFTTKEKGNYGEMLSDYDAERNGFHRISNDRVTGLDSKVRQGLDAVYYNPKTGKYLIVDSKFGTSQLGMTADGKQMSKNWIFERLSKGLDQKYVDAIKTDWGTDKVACAVYHVDPNTLEGTYSLLSSTVSTTESTATSFLVKGITDPNAVFNYLPAPIVA